MTDQDRFLSFSLGKEEYAVPLLSVKEVLALPETTPVPQTPAYFTGIMNLRGQVISVMDLRTKLGIKPQASSENVVVICQIGELVVGVTVDSVNSVLSPEATDLSDRPDLGPTKNAQFVSGVYRKGEHLVLLLDVGKALSLEDHQIVAAQAKKAA
jgi:purine-binding chemotaxis protein CheW